MYNKRKNIKNNHSKKHGSSHVLFSFGVIDEQSFLTHAVLPSFGEYGSSQWSTQIFATSVFSNKPT
jgi:zinc transporter ZupT